MLSINIAENMMPYASFPNCKVVALEIIFLTCLYKAFIGLLDTVIKNVREAKENGRLNVARCQFVNHFLKVYLYTILTGSNVHVTLIVDAKIVYAPSFDVVEPSESSIRHLRIMIEILEGWSGNM